MEFIAEEINKYVEEHTSPSSSLLDKITRETHLQVLMPRMLSGHLQGRVLSMFSTMIKPKRILEIGTFTGFSALCLAEGLTIDGILYTIDINEELEERVRGYFKESKLEDKIQYFIGNALDIIPTIKEDFDLVFIDADKINYTNYYNYVINQVNKGGFIIIDNVLWSGKVVVKQTKIDEDTQAIINFNRMVQEDPRVENVLFPIRDGLMVVRKVV